MSEPDELTRRIRGGISIEDLNFNISPTVTPFAFLSPATRVKKRKTGGSMRQRRRGMMKPLRFTPQPKAARIHEWRIDA